MDWLTHLWERLSESARFALVALASAALGALIALFRETLAALLRRFGEWVAGLLKGQLADRRFERRYLKWLAGECKRISLIGVFPARPERAPHLQDVFVEPLLSEPPRERRRPPMPEEETPRIWPPDDGWARRISETEEPPRPLSLAEAMRRSRRLVVLGEPGAGKSTLLQFLALRAAGGGSDQGKHSLPTDGKSVPVLLPLRELAASDAFTAMKRYVEKRTDRIAVPPEGYFRRLAEQGRGLFLLDGLDEVLGLGDEAYRRVCDAVNSLATVYPRNRFVVTSRVAGWREQLSPDFLRLSVQPFDPDRRREFARRWYRAVEASAATGEETADAVRIRERQAMSRAEDLVKSVESSDRLRRLAANPMLLSVMAMVHRTDVTLPRERAQLYARCAELLLERWDVGRGVEDRGTTGLTLAQKEALMQAIGYEFHQRGARFLRRREVESVMTGVLPSLGQPAERAGELLDWIERRSGLLADGDFLTFAHLAFQEYFAAKEALRREGGLDWLLEPACLFDPWWREVLFLCAALADDATDLVRRVYSPEEDDLLRRRLFLAGRCLGEATKVAPGLRTEIRNALLQIWREGYRKQREEAIQALAVRPDEETVAYFLAALEDENAGVRWRAAEALGRLGVADARVVEALLAALEDEWAEVRDSAFEALWNLSEKQGLWLGPDGEIRRLQAWSAGGTENPAWA